MVRTNQMNVVFLGTAGSGKTFAAHAFQNYTKRLGQETTMVNLDPGVLELPYEVDVDVREWIDMDQLMTENKLGPNGAQILAADMVALELKKVVALMERTDDALNIIDTPGQMELFTFRPASEHIINTLGRDETVLVFMHDSAIVKHPKNLVANIMLYGAAQMRLGAPSLHLLSKSDLLNEEELDSVLSWVNDIELLDRDLAFDEEDASLAFTRSMLSGLDYYMDTITMIPWSSTEMVGMDKLDSLLENIIGWDSESSS